MVGLYAGAAMTDQGFLMTADGARAVDPYAMATEVLFKGDAGTDPADAGRGGGAVCSGRGGGDDGGGTRRGAGRGAHR